jgi:DNA-binding MarR family transcriptional regulator
MAAPRTSDLTSHLGFWLRYVSNHVSQAFARKLDSRDVTVAEWVLMRELHDLPDAAPSQIAEKLGMTRGAITKLADRLIDKQLLVRRPDPTDGRAQSLALTAKGRKLVPELAALADQNDAEFFDHLKASERESLIRVLQDIVDRRGLRTVPTR